MVIRLGPINVLPCVMSSRHRWRMGTQVMVFLNDYKMVREAFSRPEITDRPDWETFKFFEDPAVGEASQQAFVSV